MLQEAWKPAFSACRLQRGQMGPMMDPGMLHPIPLPLPHPFATTQSFAVQQGQMGPMMDPSMLYATYRCGHMHMQHPLHASSALRVSAFMNCV
eukprot:1161622-Pelagomonas_calceolata.AAC.21